MSSRLPLSPGGASRPNTKPALAVVLALGVGAFGFAGVAQAQTPEVERLLGLAKTKQLQAQQAKANAAQKLQQAADDEVAAEQDQREARILTARALALMHADANKERAFSLRHEANELAADAHSKFIEYRNNVQRVAHYRHAADELTKAASEVKDQAGIAASLQADARAQTAAAQRAEQQAAADRAAAETLERRIVAMRAEAQKLDPETARQLAEPAPARPVLHTAAQR